MDLQVESNAGLIIENDLNVHYTEAYAQLEQDFLKEMSLSNPDIVKNWNYTPKAFDPFKRTLYSTEESIADLKNNVNKLTQSNQPQSLLALAFARLTMNKQGQIKTDSLKRMHELSESANEAFHKAHQAEVLNEYAQKKMKERESGSGDEKNITESEFIDPKKGSYAEALKQQQAAMKSMESSMDDLRKVNDVAAMNGANVDNKVDKRKKAVLDKVHEDKQSFLNNFDGLKGISDAISRFFGKKM